MLAQHSMHYKICDLQLECLSQGYGQEVIKCDFLTGEASGILSWLLGTAREIICYTNDANKACVEVAHAWSGTCTELDIDYYLAYANCTMSHALTQQKLVSAVFSWHHEQQVWSCKVHDSLWK